MKGKRKQIAFDLDYEKLKRYYVHSEEAYFRMKQVFEMNGFEPQLGSIYTSKEPMYARHVDAFLKNISTMLPWLSECTTDINVTDVGRVYDLMDEIDDYCSEYEADPDQMQRFSYKRVLEDKAANFDILPEAKPNESRKQFTFDLNSAKGSPLYDFFEAANGRNAYRQIELFLQRYGFEKVQWSVYASERPLSQKHVDAILKNMCKELPWLSECSNGFLVTDVGDRYKLNQDVKEYCAHYGVARRKMRERVAEKLQEREEYER